MKLRRLLGVAVVSVLPIWEARAADPKPAPAAIYKYTAATVGSPRVQGTVTVSGISWQCSSSACTASGPWPVPGIGACQALAGKVGALRSYGHSGRQLSAQDLERCNAGLAASTSKIPAARPAPAAQPGPAGTPMAKVKLDPAQQRQLKLRGDHFATLARVRSEAEAEARARREAEAERRRRANSRYGEDCDDTRRDVHPGAAEICDGRDNNCDGLVDEGQTLRRYLDADGDGHGDPAHGVDACPADVTAAARSAESLGGGWLVEVGNDCDDKDPARWRECQ